MSSNRIAAVGLQVLSYAATANFFAFFLEPGTNPRMWLIVGVVAVLIEGLFVAVKESAFQPGLPPKIIACIFGYGPDGVINAGGIMFFAAALLTFRPIAAMLGMAEVDLSNPDEILLIVIGISTIFGFALSIAPHILWRDWSKRASARTA